VSQINDMLMSVQYQDIVRQMIDRLRPGCELEVDGGIDADTAPLVVMAGATVLVAGSSIYHAADGVTAGMERLRASVK